MAIADHVVRLDQEGLTFGEYREKMRVRYQESHSRVLGGRDVVVVKADYWQARQEQDGGRDDVTPLGEAEAYRDGHYNRYIALAVPPDWLNQYGGSRPGSGIKPGNATVSLDVFNFPVTRQQTAAIARLRGSRSSQEVLRELVHQGIDALREGRSPFTTIISRVPRERTQRGSKSISDESSVSIEALRLGLDYIELAESVRILGETDYKLFQRLLQAGLWETQQKQPELYHGLQKPFLYPGMEKA